MNMKKDNAQNFPSLQDVGSLGFPQISTKCGIFWKNIFVKFIYIFGEFLQENTGGVASESLELIWSAGFNIPINFLVSDPEKQLRTGRKAALQRVR